LNLPVALTGPRVWLALHPVIMGGPSVDRCDSERSPVLVAALLPSWSRPITCTPSARCRPTIGFIRGRWRHIKGDFSRRVAAVDTIPQESPRRVPALAARLQRAHHPQRYGSRPPYRLRPFQPAQARLVGAGAGLAVLAVPPIRLPPNALAGRRQALSVREIPSPMPTS
jgi:hypothetical protein